MKKKKLYSMMLAMAMTVTAIPVHAMAVDLVGDDVVGNEPVMMEEVSESAVSKWVDIYQKLGVDAIAEEGLYDEVSSATEFKSFHAKDIPAVINRVTDEAGNVKGLDGANLTGKESSQKVALAGASYEYSSGYGYGEFDIIPDDTLEGYVWNEYLAGLYAVTISDGSKTVGALPWIDFYGESATSGPHYNKVQIALNSGTAKALNQAEVHRFDAFTDEKGNLKPGTYTVTLYSEGYENLVAEAIEVKQVSGVEFLANDATLGSASVTVTGVDQLPADFDPVYTVDGSEQTMSVVTGRFTSYTVSLPENLAIGSHTIKISDKNGKYVDLSANFLVTTDQFMGFYDPAAKALVKAEGVSEEAWSAYLAAIQTVTVNGTEYTATGRRGVKIVAADGVLDLNVSVNGDTVFQDHALNTVMISAQAYTSNVTAIVEKGEIAADEVYYTMMNVPYKDFFAAEYADEDLEQVDVVSTATTSKFKMTGTTGLAQGTYNDGTNICGNTVYVKMTYAQFKQMFNPAATAHDDYYMSSVTKEEPAAYKTLNDDLSFSAMSQVKDAAGLGIASYTDNSMYGDHQIALEGVSAGTGVNGESCTFLGAVFTTSDSKSYAMYALENLWYSSRNPNLEIAWSVKEGQGLRKGHNNPNNPLFYQYDMNGKLLTNIKLFTSIGVYDIACNQKLAAYHDYDNIEKVEAKAPSYTKEGNIEYYICGGCGKYFSDAELLNEIELKDTRIAKLAQMNQSMTVNASKTSITGANIAKASQKVTLTVKKGKGTITYKVSNSKYMSMKGNVLTFKKGTPAGTYKVTVKAAGTEAYKAASKSVTIKIVKSAQPMKLSMSSKTLKASALKKKAQSFTVKVTKAEGKVSFKSGSKKITVTSKGKVTVKKGIPKGTYKITVTAAGNGCFNKGSKTVTVKVK